MRIPFSVGAPHRLLALFVLATIVPSAALVWLGWQLLEQDRRLDRQRIHDVLESTANHVSAGIDRELQSIERELAGLSAPSNRALVGSGTAVAVRLTHSGVVTHAGSPLLYRPAPRTSTPEPGGAVWADAESLEFARKDADGAARAYRAIAQSSDANTRAGALVRLARTQKTARRDDQALETYTTLATLTTATINGDPADLMARWARVRLLDAQGRHEAMKEEATALARDLENGRWAIDRTTFLTYTRRTRACDRYRARAERRRARASRRGRGPDLGRLANALAAIPLQHGTPVAARGQHAGPARLARGRRRTPPLRRHLRLPQRRVATSLAGEGHQGRARWRRWPDRRRRDAGEHDDAAGGQTQFRHAAAMDSPHRGDLSTRRGHQCELHAASNPDCRDGVAPRSDSVHYLPGRSHRPARAVGRPAAGRLRLGRLRTSSARRSRRSPTSRRFSAATFIPLTIDDGSTTTCSRARRTVCAGSSRRCSTSAACRRAPRATGWRHSTCRPCIGGRGRRVPERRRPLAVTPCRSTAPGQLPAVDGDPEALSRAIWNLLENAAKYSPAGSPIAVRVTWTAGRWRYG